MTSNLVGGGIGGPVRVCCGQNHHGAVCPDGLTMCCLCYDRFPRSELYIDADGVAWNACVPCRDIEELELAQLAELEAAERGSSAGQNELTGERRG